MKFNFEKLSKSYRKKKLLVVGDVILDAYVWGIVDRMSPEAPVPIVQSGEHGQQPGGAANVALNLTNLGAKVSLVGLVGDDDEGVSLTNALSNDANIIVAGGESASASTSSFTYSSNYSYNNRPRSTGAYYMPKAQSLKLVDAINSNILIDVTVSPLPQDWDWNEEASEQILYPIEYMSEQIIDAIKSYYKH